MRKLLLLIWLVVVAFTALAQQRKISGKVTSAEDGSPLPGVNVLLKGTSSGGVTDSEGNFSVEVEGSSPVLVFSFIGLRSQEVLVADQTIVNVQLTADVTQLSEVVVTALGVAREQKTLGYAVQSIKSDELMMARQNNLINSLQGKIAGVQITTGSAQGGSSRILIRGANSITGNNQPLFVVDGTPIDNSNYASANQMRAVGGYDYGNAALDINPEDIESVNVLKGANAAALYGSRGANGVIEIVTKKGSASKANGIGISVNSGVTLENVMLLPKYQNSYGGGYSDVTETNALGQNVFYYGADESWGPRLDGRPMRQYYSYFSDDPNYGQQTPWVTHPTNIEDFFRTGVTWNNNISFTGGDDKANFRLSYTNYKQEFVLENGDQKRHTLSFNGSSNLTEKLTASVSANYINTRTTGRIGTGYGEPTNPAASFMQWHQRQLDMSAMREYITGSGEQKSWNITSPTNPNPLYWDNPFWALNRNYENDGRDRMFGTISLSYQITDEIKVTGRVMDDFYTDRREERISNGSIDQSKYSEAIRDLNELNTDVRVEYNKRFGEQFSIFAFLGANHRRKTFHENTGSTVGGLSVENFFNLQNSASRPNISDVTTEQDVNSVFANASIGYNDMLFLDLSGRNDWSSTLPSDAWSFSYGAATASFVFTELLTTDVLSFGKLRGGYALAGSDTDPYRLYNIYASSGNFGANPQFTVPGSKNNSLLKPERTSSFETGIDLNFLSNRIGFGFTYYDKTTEDLIYPVAVSGATGYTSVIVNAGKMSNKGIEVSLNATVVKLSNGFEWGVSLNWAKNKNELVELAEGITSIRLASLFGGSLEARKGVPYGAIIGSDFVYSNGNKVVTDGYYDRTSPNQYLGSVLADWTGGVRNIVSFKNLNLSFLIDGQKGGAVYSVSNMFGKYTGIFEETVKGDIRERGVILDGVNSDGSPNTTVVPAQYAFYDNYRLHGAYVYDATYFKLREATLGYTLPKSLVSNLPFRNVSISIIGRNLAFLYKRLPHVDPETTTNSGNVQGIEGAAVPPVRSWGFNLKFELQ